MFFVLCVTAAIPAFSNDSISSKLVRTFNNTFPDAENVTWHSAGGSSEAYFDRGGIKTHIWYDAQGQVTKTRRDYEEKDLCPFMRAKLAKKYGGKKIFGVTEINDENELYYVVVLEDANTWTTVRADAMGYMKVVDQFKKAGTEDSASH